MTIKSRAQKNPRTVALRFRAYRLSLDHGGDLTLHELAEALDVPTPRLQRALSGEQWAATLRSARLDVPQSPEYDGADEFLAQQEARAFAGVAA